MVAKLLTNVLLEITAEWSENTPPPSCAALLENWLSTTLNVPLLFMPPPEVPDFAGDELCENVTRATVRLPWLYMAPPPLIPSLAMPLVSVRSLRTRAAVVATSKMRKAAVLGAVDRSIVAPLPIIVTAWFTVGNPFPPSEGLFAAESRYVQPLVSVTVPWSLPASAAEMAEMRLAAEQDTGVADTGGAVPINIATKHISTEVRTMVLLHVVRPWSVLHEMGCMCVADP